MKEKAEVKEKEMAVGEEVGGRQMKWIEMSSMDGVVKK